MDTAYSGSDHTGWALVPTNIPQPFNPGDWEMLIQGRYIRPHQTPKSHPIHCPRPWLSCISSTKAKNRNILQSCCSKPAPSLLPTPVWQRTWLLQDQCYSNPSKVLLKQDLTMIYFFLRKEDALLQTKKLLFFQHF